MTNEQDRPDLVPATLIARMLGVTRATVTRDGGRGYGRAVQVGGPGHRWYIVRATMDDGLRRDVEKIEDLPYSVKEIARMWAQRRTP